MKHGKGISCAVTDGKDHMIATNAFAIFCHNSGQLSVFLQNVRDLCVKTNLSAK